MRNAEVISNRAAHRKANLDLQFSVDVLLRFQYCLQVAQQRQASSAGESGGVSPLKAEIRQ